MFASKLAGKYRVAMILTLLCYPIIQGMLISPIYVKILTQKVSFSH